MAILLAGVVGVLLEYFFPQLTQKATATTHTKRAIRLTLTPKDDD